MMVRILALALFASASVESNQVFGPDVHYSVEKIKMPNVVKLTYADRQVFYDCANKAPIMSVVMSAPNPGLEVQADGDTFYFEKKMPSWCQPYTNLKTGASIISLVQTDLGHIYYPRQLSPYFLGSSHQSLEIAKRITNMTMVISQLNSGPLAKLQEHLKCVSSLKKIIHISGAVFKDDSNDFFKKEYNISTPDYFYHIMLGPEGISESYLFSNLMTSTGVMNNSLIDYSFSIQDIETLIGFTLPNVSGYDKKAKRRNLLTKKQLDSCVI